MANREINLGKLGLKKVEKEGVYSRFLSLYGEETGLSYVLITEDSFSPLHKIPVDEVWIFLEGDSVEQITLEDNKSVKKKIINSDNRVTFIKANEWQSTKLVSSGYALFITSTSPCYHIKDFILPDDEFKKNHLDLKNYFSSEN